MVQIIPAILAITEEEYKQKLQKIENSGSFKNGWVQIDLMDNKFVQNQSIGIEVVAKYPTDLKVEAQLMVEYPSNWIDELVKVKVDRIVFPVEDGENIRERLQHIKNHGIEAGLSLNPETQVDVVKPYLDNLDVILIMSVDPGFGGQEFKPEVISKIKELKELRPDLIVGVDGGVSSENVKQIVESGADYLVIGTHLVEGDIEENLENIWENING